MVVAVLHIFNCRWVTFVAVAPHPQFLIFYTPFSQKIVFFKLFQAYTIVTVFKYL